MSVVIRLQNLPISAKSADIRNFFGGLRIPSGGVHIIGGEKGEAFIAFNSDEDARLAMRKDGGKIKDSRVKLLLSSRMEMQYEVEKITKGSHGVVLPKVERNPSSDTHKFSERAYGSGRSSDQYRRSRSPRRRTQSHRSPPRTRENSSRNDPFNPADKGLNPSYSWENSQISNNSKAGLSTSEIQAQLEKKIAEAIESNPFLMSRYGENANNTHGNSFNAAAGSEPSYPVSSNQDTTPVHMDASNSYPPDAYYVTLSGLDPYWDIIHLQTFLNISFLTPNDIFWEMDSMGQRTGAAFVRLINRDDFETLMKRATFTVYDRLITVTECYPSTVDQYFPKAPGPPLPPLKTENAEHKNLCYSLKGLPFSCTYDDVVQFFRGFEVDDIVIFYGPGFKATGLGYVSFTNYRDFKDAYSCNKNYIYNRFIQMFPCTSFEMAKAKESIAENPPVGFTPNRSRRSLCALITGLPAFTTVKKLISFFDENGFTADAIHITLNRKKCDGRAFIEFTNFRDFDLAIKLNGNKFIDNAMICVKQVLFDEMVKILEGQKAKHHYANPELTEPAFVDNVEKVPYLWEPPDAAEEKAKVSSADSSRKPLSNDSDKFSRNQFHSAKLPKDSPPFHSSKANVLQIDYAHISPVMSIQDNAVHCVDQQFFQPPPNFDPGLQFPVQPFPLPQNDFNTSMQGLEEPFLNFKDDFQKQNVNRNAFRSNHRVLSEIPHHEKTMADSREKKSVVKEIKKGAIKKDAEHPSQSAPRDSIKFNVNKNFGISAKNEIFESEGSYEKKMKLSKLSPPKETAQKQLIRKEKADAKRGSDQKQWDEKGKNSVSKREAGQKQAYEKHQDYGVKNESAQKYPTEKGKASSGERKNSQDYKSRSKSKYPEQNQSRRPVPQKRKRSVSPFRHLTPPRYVPCVVQMSNVSLEVRTQDLFDFLHGFSFDKTSVIRKYTDSGEPLTDVRVAFINRKEADLAMRQLQGCYLKDMQVKMFNL